MPEVTAKLAGRIGRAFPKMCGAMDGGAQAHMDVLEAFFGKALPILPGTKRPG